LQGKFSTISIGVGANGCTKESEMTMLRTVFKAMGEERAKHLAEQAVGKSTGKQCCGGKNPILWLGSDRDFGDVVLDLHQKGLIQARSKTDALEKLSAHFIRKNGKQFNARSILQNLSNRFDVKGR
jgi:hypothetical protein